MRDTGAMTPEQRWRHLRDNGPKKLINLVSNELISDKPSWLDEQRWARAKDAIQKFFLGVQYSSFNGLLLILQLPDGLEPLLVTGNSKDIPSLHERYVNTTLHVDSWYDDDVFDPSTKGYKSIRRVRGMHKRVQKLMNEKYKTIDVHGEPKMWMNQYDVALTQFAFIGLCLLWPEKSAMIAATKEDLELVNYYWRVLGYLMGVEDEFNFCGLDKYEDIREFSRLVFENEYLGKFRSQPCATGLAMSQSICLALSYYAPLIKFNQLAHWWRDQFKFNGYEPQPMTLAEKAIDYWTQLSFNHLLKYNNFLKFSTALHRKRYKARVAKRDKVFEKLKTQYKDATEHTHYSNRVDYFSSVNDDDKISAASLRIDTNTNGTGPTNNIEENNNTSEPVAAKAGGCPFGFTGGAVVPVQQVEVAAAN